MSDGIQSTTKYYRFVDPVLPGVPPANTELHAFEYNNFMITRSDNEFRFWSIKTLDMDDPPLVLRGSYTVRQKAEEAVDNFIKAEHANQEKYGNRDNSQIR